MDARLILICFLTFTIDLIGTLAYSARIAGVRTRRVAASFAIFNILVLVSRTSNSFQGPLLAKRIENSLASGGTHNLLFDFRCFLLSATLGTVVGALLTPSFQRVFSKAVESFQRNRSILRLIMRAFSQGGLAHLKGSLTLPSSAALTGLRKGRTVSAPIILLNVGGRRPVGRGRFRRPLRGIPASRVADDCQQSILHREWSSDDSALCFAGPLHLSDDGGCA